LFVSAIEILFLINYLKRLIRVFVLELRDRTESKDGEFKDRITDVEVLCPICQVEFDNYSATFLSLKWQ